MERRNKRREEFYSKDRLIVLLTRGNEIEVIVAGESRGGGVGVEAGVNRCQTEKPKVKAYREETLGGNRGTINFTPKAKKGEFFTRENRATAHILK